MGEAVMMLVDVSSLTHLQDYVLVGLQLGIPLLPEVQSLRLDGSSRGGHSGRQHAPAASQAGALARDRTVW